MKKRGFTLIELIVVMTIIGILATVVIVNVRGAGTKSRDARRIADLKQIQSAVELFGNANNNHYPDAACENWTYTVHDERLKLATGQYLSVMPLDPKTPNEVSYYNEQYIYLTNSTAANNSSTPCEQITTNSTVYYLMSVLENGSNPAINVNQVQHASERANYLKSLPAHWDYSDSRDVNNFFVLKGGDVANW